MLARHRIFSCQHEQMIPEFFSKIQFPAVFFAAFITWIVWSQFCLVKTRLVLVCWVVVLIDLQSIKLLKFPRSNWLPNWLYWLTWGRSYMCVKMPFFSLSNSCQAFSISSFESCSSGLCSNNESCWWYFITQSFYLPLEVKKSRNLLLCAHHARFHPK